MDRFANRRPLTFSFLVTLVFVALSIVALLLGALMPGGAAGREAGTMLGRLGAGLLALWLLARLGWLRRAGTNRWGAAPQREGQAWLMMLPVLLYLAIVFPLLFTGSLRLNLADPALAAATLGNALAVGLFEETFFRGLIMTALLGAYGATRRGVVKSLVLSALFFSLPHALNLLAGSPPLRVGAQLVWALLLGIVFGALLLAGRSLWPVVALHGIGNGIVYLNRLGVEVVMTPEKALLMAAAPLPVLVYAFWLLHRSGRLPNGAEPGASGVASAG